MTSSQGDEKLHRYVIVDDAADELLSELPNTRVPINLFIDGVPILSTESSRSELAQRLISAGTVTTAGPTIPQYLNALQIAREQSSLITICTVTSKLSVSWQNAHRAQEIFLANNPEIKVELLDTLHCATAQAAVVDSLPTDAPVNALRNAERTRQLQEFYIIHPPGSHGRKVTYARTSRQSSDHIIEMRNGILSEVSTDQSATQFIQLRLATSPPVDIVRISYSEDRKRADELICEISLDGSNVSFSIMSPGVSPHVGLGAVAISWTSSMKNE